MTFSSSLVGGRARSSGGRRNSPLSSSLAGAAMTSSVRRGASLVFALAAASSSIDASASAFVPPRRSFGVPSGRVVSTTPKVTDDTGSCRRIFDSLETVHRRGIGGGASGSGSRLHFLSMVLSEPDVDSSSSSSLRASPSRGATAESSGTSTTAAPRKGNSNRSSKMSPAAEGASATFGKVPPKRRRRRKKYQRKRQMPETERRQERMRREMQEKYEQVQKEDETSIWGFEKLFPAPVWDEATIQRDLYEVSQRDGKMFLGRLEDQRAEDARKAKGDKKKSGPFAPKIDGAVSEKMKKIRSAELSTVSSKVSARQQPVPKSTPPKPDSVALRKEKEKKANANANSDTLSWGTDAREEALAAMNATSSPTEQTVIDPALTRMVEDRLYGFRRTALGDFQYDTSLMGDGAVQFRDGVRLGNPLKVNADLLNFHAKRDFSHNRLEEAEEMYERALSIDPRDGRAYLGLSRIAQRRRDFAKARECLRAGIANSVDLPRDGPGGTVLVDFGANPFLLQALGCLEERIGRLAEAEALYVAATRSRPSHAASWVALAQLRTRKFRMGAAAGRACYREAERELRLAGLKPSAHVYTAWASMEYKKAGDVRRARELFEMALEVDPRCSAAWLQLGVMEGVGRENWDRAQECFESALKRDKKNSRVLQAYAIMESRRPDGDSREAIGLFERALKVKPRDAGVLQAYALYVADLGDVDAARDLLRRGTKVDKRHAAVWQAWGVLETRHGTAQAARDIFQQGIWACAQSGGGQSGGRRCARLWQAWGVLESREGDHAAARRCFSRALDADKRNVAAVTAWTLMEEDLGRFSDARSIFERALRQLPPSSEEKMAVWRAYELMEQKDGNQNLSQQVYQRSMRETFTINDDFIPEPKFVAPREVPSSDDESILKTSREVEVVRWKTDRVMGGGSEVWLNNGNIEGKVPASTMKKSNSKKAQQQQQSSNK
eukprot:CAMPEP_0113552806 /NCGR_PEP_ID=MMETSP0015_2-20120614/15265_1 /TAXON_ID=2838 /ORGANISM="Odontella" /LENGTH=953 /DNA_ID=CAMNT_0000453811 /DNA_START=208 /DNA_END=3069 /DNA_ORIENTATION=- /assembly_acc=CAM_ASM_000160